MKVRRTYENNLKESHPMDEAPFVVAPEGLSDETESSPAEPVKTVKKSSRIRKAIQDFLGGDYLSKQTVAGNIGYIVFLGFLAMVYISNTYYTEKIFKSIERTKNELKELRYQYITTKSALMFQGRQSEISKRAITLGLKESKTPPFKIQYSGEQLKPEEKTTR